MTKTTTFLLVAAAIAAAVPAFAGDQPEAPKDAVEVKLAAKPGETFRFKETESSSTEVDGKAQKTVEASHVYTVRVKAARDGGGLDLEMTLEEIRIKQVRGGRTTDIDTTKEPDPASPPQALMLDAFSKAMTGSPFTVSVDAHGAPKAVSGLREIVTKGLASTPYAGAIPIDQVLGDEDCMKLAREIMTSAPPQPVAPRAKISFDVSDEVNGQALDFAVETTLASAAADTAAFASKFTWKPGEAAKSDGAKPAGGGEAAATFNRKDGFVVSMKRHLEANRETAAMKATSHSDVTIERLPAK